MKISKTERGSKALISLQTDRKTTKTCHDLTSFDFPILNQSVNYRIEITQK